MSNKKTNKDQIGRKKGKERKSNANNWIKV